MPSQRQFSHHLPAILLAILGANGVARAQNSGLAFAPGKPTYTAQSPALNDSETLSLELWLKPDAACPEGAVILEKRINETGTGFRLELAKGGLIRFLTNAPQPCISSIPLPTDRTTHLVAIFNPRQSEVSLFFDGKQVASLPKVDRGFDRSLTVLPLAVAADQEGANRFIGTIERIAIYNRPLTAAETVSSSREGAAGLIAAWNLDATSGHRIASTLASAPALTVPFTFRGADRPPAEDPTLTLWYPRPARQWVEALALGNGRLGGMVFGGVEQERVQMNEDTIWQGSPYDPANPAALETIKQMRELVMAGKPEEADALGRKSGMGTPSTQAAYQTLGSLLLNFPASESPITDYRRSLDIHTAIAKTTYTRDGITFTREVFTSAPDQVLVVRLTADRPHSIRCGVTFSTPHRGAKLAARGTNELVLSGTNGNFGAIPGKIQFQSTIRAIPEGGAISPGDSSLDIDQADAVTILVSCGTNFINYHDLTANAAQRADTCIAAAAKEPYAALRQRHIADFQKLFDRVSLDLGSSDNLALPTDERVRRFGEGKDLPLAAMFFQYGRYLLISSSRPGDQAANLQGIWNEGLSAPWGGKYTVNINTEMNYWPAETTNLAECAQPLFQLVRDIATTGQNTAKVMYGARGWVCHHNTDLWRATAPIDWPTVGMWPVGGAWLSTNLWEHYQFSHDEKFLRDSYPIFKGACEFFLDTLVEDPKTHHLVTCPSISPESGGLVMAPAMDMQILRDLFQMTARTSEILGVDEDFRKQILATRERLVPHQIGKYGQLQEWMQDRDREVDGNRHSSHLYALFPSAQITSADPRLFAAAKKSLLGRGDGATGWALAWKINLWARALDGDHAYKLITVLLTPPKGGSQGGGTYPNLFDAHPPFQIDGNFGATSGMAEMLLQSHEGFLRILPALPSAWQTGEVKGLCARGGFELSIRWHNGQLESLTLHSKLGGPCTLRYADQTTQLQTHPDETLHLDKSLKPM